MTTSLFTITQNVALTKDVYKMCLQGDTSDITRPGQFVNIALQGKYLRRPISVCDVQGDILTLLYKVVGTGTAQMAKMAPGVQLDLLTGLGNGFSLEESGNAPLLVGGGVGVPPMFLLCKELLKQGKKPTVVLGFNTKSELFYKQEFEDLGVKVLVSTVDGSAGYKGFVTDAIRQSGTAYTYYYACGPMPMLKALCDNCSGSGQLSFEERMGCGFGACMGCTCKTKYGNKRICKDGPVLKKEEIIW